MRIWISLTTVLALSMYVSGNDRRYSYEPCPEEKVCIFFDHNACHGDSTKAFRGYVWENDGCNVKNYGLNYIGLEILPIPPSRWDIKMTITYCHRNCNNDAEAQKIGKARLEEAKFIFRQFNITFPVRNRVHVLWKNNREISDTEMKYIGHFSVYGNDWQWYNMYTFSIYSDRGKLIDLANGNIEYYGYVLKENEGISSRKLWTTALEEPLRFQEKLKKINGCDMDKYFDKSKCPNNSICVMPFNSDETNTCKFGKLEFIEGNGDWKEATRLSCKGMKWKNDNEDNINLEQARCLIAKPCSLDFSLELNKCLNPIDCSAPNLSNEHNVKCPTGFDLEVEGGDWRYHKDVTCYGNYLYRMDSKHNILDTVEKVRCRKQRKCNLSKFFVSSKCALDEHCLTPSDNTYSCDGGYELQYTSIAEPKSWNALDKLECIEDQLRLTIKTELSDLVPLNVRCMKKKKCDLKLFAQPVVDCEADNICVEPSLESNKKVICPVEFGLQAQSMLYEWQTVTITCIKDEELIVESTNTFPLQIRCIHKNITKFFDPNDCKDDEKCKEPKNCESLKCDFGDHNPLWNLQRKSSKTNVWSDVRSANCNSGIFVIDNVPETADSFLKFRCVLKKCTSCENPCPNCVIDSSFNKSNKWDECVEFNCGPNTRTYYGVGENVTKSQNVHFECSNGASFWKVNGSSEAKHLKIQCEKLCWLQNPLKSTCPPNSPSCKEHDSSDFEQLSCGRNIYVYFKNGDLLHINKMSCDKHDGLWKANNVDGNKEVIIPEGSNVYCYEGPCEESRIFPSCESDDNECTDYDIENHRYTCKEPFTFWERYRSDGEWKEMKGVSELQCLAGSIVANGKRKDYDFQANCRIEVPKTAVAKSQLGVYLGVMFLVLLLTVVVIATIILRISGKGWLHTLVIELIRNRNKKRARSHSSASSLPKSNQSRTPIAKSPMANSTSKKTQKGSPSSKSKSSSQKMRKTTGRPSSSLSSVPASSDATSKMNSLANEPKKVFVV